MTAPIAKKTPGVGARNSGDTNSAYDDSNQLLSRPSGKRQATYTLHPKYKLRRLGVLSNVEIVNKHTSENEVRATKNMFFFFDRGKKRHRHVMREHFITGADKYIVHL